jgi:hypothetical protein
MTINHNDVYDFLHGLRQQTGVDLISQPNMVNVHGRAYPTIGNNVMFAKDSGWGSVEVHIPHENGYVTHLSNYGRLPSSKTKFTKTIFQATEVNDLVPGTYTTKSGLIRPTFHTGTTRGVNRVGPYLMPLGEDGNLQHAFDGSDVTHIHKFLEHISSLPSPQGEARNIWDTKGNAPIPRDQMGAIDLAGGIGHRREFAARMTMPKGTEHHLAISEHKKSVYEQPNRYLYDIGSESLIEAPKEMHADIGKDIG